MTTPSPEQARNNAVTCYHPNPELVIYRIGSQWYMQNGYALGEKFENLPPAPPSQLLENQRSRIARNTVAYLAAAFTAAGLGVLAWTILHISVAEKHSGLGDFLAGTVGPLWALAGVGLVYVAFRGQQEQARIQEQQILSAERNARLQQFESAFFQLLNLHNEIVRGLRITISAEHGVIWGSREVNGREVISTIYSVLQKAYNKEAERRGEQEGVNVHALDRDAENQFILDVYEPLHQRHQDELGHYFRNIYTITKYVVESGIDEPQRYINILRAQLASDELLMLFYNCLSRWGRGPFKKYVEDFHLLHNLPVDQLLSPSHERQYHPSAFGTR